MQEFNGFRILIIGVLACWAGTAAGCGAAGSTNSASVVAATAVAGLPDQAFKDPAPPEVKQLELIEAPAARPHPRTKFHQAPKPLPPGAITSDWTSFLGPNHNGVSPETKLLEKFDEASPRLVWELAKGTGYVSPAVLGDRLVYVHRVGDEGIVECVRAETGDLFWEFRYDTQFEDRFGYNNGPRASPVIDGERVFVYSAEGKLFCLKLATGQLYWQRDLAKEFRMPQDFFGTSTTPLIDGKNLIINLGAPGGPCVAAFDTESGRMVWGAGDKWGPSYASPVPATVQGRHRVFVFAGGESRPPTGGLLCLDPASGRIDFEFPWRSRVYESVNASSPVIVDNQVFVSANYFTGSALVNISPNLKHTQLWHNKDLGTHWNTAIYRDGYFYGFDGHFEDDAALLCIDAKTGKTVWREVPEWTDTVNVGGVQRQVPMSTCRGTLLWVDGRFLCLGEFGHLLWLDLSPKGYRESSRRWLFAARETWSPPVISRGLLYLCQNTRGMIDRGSPRLLCFDMRSQAE